MKKKLIALTLALLMLAGCGSTAAPEPTAAPEITETPQVETPEPTTEGAESNGVEVEKNLFSVELTIPAGLMGETTQKELDATAAENDGIKSITLNEDGSATYKMTKAAHKKMVDEMAEASQSSLDELVASEDNSITAIKANDDYSEFDVALSTEEVGLVEGITAMGLYMIGGLYNAFAGTNVDDIVVRFYNPAGELLSESDSSSFWDE